MVTRAIGFLTSQHRRYVQVLAVASGTTTYKRLFLRWGILRGWMPAIVFTAIAIAIELLYFNYMVSRGMIDESFTISLGALKIPLSIALFLSLANAIVLLTLWMTVFESTAFVMAGPDRRVRRILYPLRMVKTAAIILTPFSLVLFTPYIVESSWFINAVASFSTSVPSFSQTAVNFYTWSFGLARMDYSVKFIVSQLSAALSSTVVSGLVLWRVKGTRNLMLALRRKR
jgi:hypothetical protein